MESRRIVDRACEIEIYAMVKLRLAVLAKRLSVDRLLDVSEWLAEGLLCASPKVREATTRAMRACFPQTSADDVRRNLAHVILATAYLPIAVRMSPRELEGLVDVSELERALDDAADRPVLFVPAHFYNTLVIAVFADVLFRRGRPLHATFIVDDDARLPGFTDVCKRRFHGDFHVPLNLLKRRGGALGILRGVLADPHRAGLVFGDIRLRKSRADVSFSVGASTLYANGGVKTLIENAPRSTAVVPCFLTLRGSGFVLECPEVLSPDVALQRLYGRLLPDYLSRYRHQWQLWYLADDLLLGGAGVAGASEAAIARA